MKKLGGNVPIDLKVNKGTLVQSVKDALKNENITINVKAKLDANTIKNLTDALNRGLNLNPNAIRNYNAQIQDLTKSMRNLGTQMQDVVNNSNGLSRVSREMRNLREAGKGATYITDTLKKLLSSFGSVFFCSGNSKGCSANWR